MSLSSSQLAIRESLYFSIPKTHPQWGIGIELAVYTALEGSGMLQFWHTSTPDNYLGSHIRRSGDNGRTWGVSEPLHKQENVTAEGAEEVKRLLGLGIHDDPLTYHRSCGNDIVFLDPDNGRLVHVYYGQYSNFAGELIENGQLFMRISADAGIDWTDPHPIIQRGAGFDERHWAREVELGRVGGIVAGIQHMEKTREGTLLLPFQIAHGKGREIPFRQGVFLGRWRDDLSDIDWDLGDYVEAPANLSSRGVMVGTVAELRDGRVFMVVRGDSSGTGLEGEIKLGTLSADGGRTWDELRPLSYEDGSTVWSSSSNSRLFRYPAGGKLYLITHIRDEPLLKAPRNPLAIAEIDERTLSLRRESVTLIKARGPLDPKDAYYEPRGIYEDRETGNLVMYIGNANLPGTAQVLRCEITVE